ncbi:PaaX family transcriptional regulator C-terminal domain-containing protein [Spongiactinospora sp. TRM90649]|uniref:PaaX family transcriptional regulator n=1 Tax=Spongiactinospora sp. TRM90649 TaxID=3031114 RepID=UPI0023F939A4|nr:PaaX family transcriptional regulator C-terminal domain-containing protein [Spongiactinospora sp. TRM90649]MDF5758308.1 PaaX family transcriptional regulator C-terminal domain-containing protein [Spongiactinospora sp. TRM90649]
MLRPQSVMLTFLGDHVSGRRVLVSAGSFIDVFARVGISEMATRSTLARMVRRGLLHRRRAGRHMYFGLTDTIAKVLQDGERRIWRTGVVNEHQREHWTLIGFSLPESWQRERHELRSRLIWAGFGPLGNGLWLAPGDVDVAGVVEDLGANVKVFAAEPRPPTDMRALVSDAYDLDGLGRKYADFLTRWDQADPMPRAPDDLARSLVLLTEWLQIIRVDPRLPVRHLPDDWPAGKAQAVCHALYERFRPQAAAIVADLLDAIPDTRPIQRGPE